MKNYEVLMQLVCRGLYDAIYYLNAVSALTTKDLCLVRLGKKNDPRFVSDIILLIKLL